MSSAAAAAVVESPAHSETESKSAAPQDGAPVAIAEASPPPPAPAPLVPQPPPPVNVDDPSTFSFYIPIDPQETLFGEKSAPGSAGDARLRKRRQKVLELYADVAAVSLLSDEAWSRVVLTGSTRPPKPSTINTTRCVIAALEHSATHTALVGVTDRTDRLALRDQIIATIESLEGTDVCAFVARDPGGIGVAIRPPTPTRGSASEHGPFKPKATRVSQVTNRLKALHALLIERLRTTFSVQFCAADEAMMRPIMADLHMHCVATGGNLATHGASATGAAPLFSPFMYAALYDPKCEPDPRADAALATSQIWGLVHRVVDARGTTIPMWVLTEGIGSLRRTSADFRTMAVEFLLCRAPCRTPVGGVATPGPAELPGITLRAHEGIGDAIKRILRERIVGGAEVLTAPGVDGKSMAPPGRERSIPHSLLDVWHIVDQPTTGVSSMNLTYEISLEPSVAAPLFNITRPAPAPKDITAVALPEMCLYRFPFDPSVGIERTTIPGTLPFPGPSDLNDTTGVASSSSCLLGVTNHILRTTIAQCVRLCNRATRAEAPSATGTAADPGPSPPPPPPQTPEQIAAALAARRAAAIACNAPHWIHVSRKEDAPPAADGIPDLRVWMWWGTNLPASCAPDYAVRLDPTEDGRRPDMADALATWNKRRRPDQGVEAVPARYSLEYRMDAADPAVSGNPYFSPETTPSNLVASMGVPVGDEPGDPAVVLLHKEDKESQAPAAAAAAAAHSEDDTKQK